VTRRQAEEVPTEWLKGFKLEEGESISIVEVVYVAGQITSVITSKLHE